MGPEDTNWDSEGTAVNECTTDTESNMGEERALDNIEPQVDFAAVFHLFRKLPAELRLTIWEMSWEDLPSNEGVITLGKDRNFLILQRGLMANNGPRYQWSANGIKYLRFSQQSVKSDTSIAQVFEKGRDDKAFEKLFTSMFAFRFSSCHKKCANAIRTSFC